MNKTNYVKVEPLFENSKKLIKEFNLKKIELEKEKDHLLTEMETITDSMAVILNSIEDAVLEKRIQLNLDIKLLTDKSDVIKKMLEETEGKIEMAYLQYAGKLVVAYREEGRIRNKYNATTIIQKHRNALFLELNDLSKQVKGQYLEIQDGLEDVFSHPIVKHHHPRYSQLTSYEDFRPRYGSFNKRVVSLEEVTTALYGGDINDLIKPVE